MQDAIPAADPWAGRGLARGEEWFIHLVFVARRPSFLLLELLEPLLNLGLHLLQRRGGGRNDLRIPV